MLALISSVGTLHRRDLEMADPTLLDPDEADCIVQGEWLARNSASKMARIGTTPVIGAVQVWTQKGDLAAQAIGKTTCLMLGEYEGETDMFLASDTYAVGSELTVQQITVDSVTRTGLCLATAGEFVYGFCTELVANNNGLLRFQKISPYIKA